MQSSRGGRFGRQTHASERNDKPNQATVNAHRAALEALFAPKTSPDPAVVKREKAKLVTGPAARAEDPQQAQKQKLLGRFLAAEGRTAVSKAANDYARAGFAFPVDQEVMLKLLDHADEERVRDALTALEKLLEKELPHRRPLLESRLRRLEEVAEDPATRELGASLRRKLAATARAGG